MDLQVTSLRQLHLDSLERPNGTEDELRSYLDPPFDPVVSCSYLSEKVLCVCFIFFNGTYSHQLRAKPEHSEPTDKIHPLRQNPNMSDS